ncbi:MAG: ATP-binding protein [Candidatus Limnocylindrales bacterium]
MSSDRATPETPIQPEGDGVPAAGPVAPPRRTLERFADQRQRLQDVASSLAQSLDPRAVAGHLLDAACGLLGAPQGWVAVISADGQFAEVLDARGYDAAALDRWSRVPLDLRTPMTVAIREQRPLLHRSMVQRHAEFPVLAERDGSTSRSEASAVVPLAFEGRTTGALAIAFDTVRDLDEDEVWFLESLAAQGSQSLERARLFAALHEREERLRFALSASGTGTWEWNVEAGRMDWSPEISALYGTEPGWAPPSLEAYLEFVHPDDRPWVAEAINAAVREGTRYEAEFRILRPDGTMRWTHGVGRVQMNEAGTPIRMIGTGLDISGRRRAEEERDRALETEREAARLRDAFIGVVSHELRTPITTIFGGTRVLARRWREMEPAARDDILGDVVEEADRLYRLVEDLLVLTRVERGSLEVSDEPIHLVRVLERVTASEGARWPGVTFEMQVSSRLPSVAGEDTYVEQVLRNLLGNAAKYGGPTSRVTITAEADADEVTLSVLDEGPGIDDAEAESLFDLFYRSAQVAHTAPGAGIGLFVCRQLVHAMGGRIRAETRPGGGAAFRVTLPRYADDEGG